MTGRGVLPAARQYNKREEARYQQIRCLLPLIVWMVMMMAVMGADYVAAAVAGGVRVVVGLLIVAGASA